QQRLNFLDALVNADDDRRPYHIFEGAEIDNTKNFRCGPVDAAQQWHELLVHNMAQSPCIWVSGADLPDNGIPRSHAGWRQWKEGAPSIADRKFEIKRRGAVTGKFRREGDETVGMTAGVKTCIKGRLVVEFAGDIGPVDAGPGRIDLDFTAMTAQFHAFHMAVGIEQPAGNQHAAAFNPEHIVYSHSHGKGKAGYRVGPVEAVCGGAHAQENIRRAAYPWQDRPDMARCLAGTGQKPAVIDFGKTPAPSSAKQKSLDISRFDRL